MDHHHYQSKKFPAPLLETGPWIYQSPFYFGAVLLSLSQVTPTNGDHRRTCSGTTQWGCSEVLMGVVSVLVSPQSWPTLLSLPGPPAAPWPGLPPRRPAFHKQTHQGLIFGDSFLRGFMVWHLLSFKTLLANFFQMDIIWEQGTDQRMKSKIQLRIRKLPAEMLKCCISLFIFYWLNIRQCSSKMTWPHIKIQETHR